MKGQAPSGQPTYNRPTDALRRIGQLHGEVLAVLRAADEDGDGDDLYPYEVSQRLRDRNWKTPIGMVQDCLDDLCALGMARRLPTGEIALELLVPVLGEIS